MATDTNENIYYADENGVSVIASGNGKIPGVSNPVAGTTYLIVSSLCSSSIIPCGVPGPAADAGIGIIFNVQVDAASNVYILANSNEIFRVDAQTDQITQITPTPTPALGNAPASAPALSSSLDLIYLDNNDNIYISDFNNADVVRVDAITGVMTLVAGTPGSPCNSSTAACGDGGLATGASLSSQGDAMFLDGTGTCTWRRQ